MRAESLSDELSNLEYPTGYVFENGEPLYEKLGKKRAENLLDALRRQGYKITHVRGRGHENQDRPHAA